MRYIFCRKRECVFVCVRERLTGREESERETVRDREKEKEGELVRARKRMRDTAME